MDIVLASMEDHANLSRAKLPNQTDLGELVGESAPMHRLYELIRKASQSSSPVLVLGETGTGKELVARAIHFTGLRRDKALVPVDCSALTPTLVESELFGHVKGAFTGADHSKVGLFQAAHDGTVFLDEIGELPMFLQAKLLRALQEKEIRPVGSTERIPINVRVIAATNRDLEAGVRAGTFRQELYFRLNVVQIRLPALRERKIDIALLVAHFLEKFSNPLQPVRAISDDALRRLMTHDWPGNVRELENTIERAVALTDSPILQQSDVLPDFEYESAPRLPAGNELMPLEELERRAIFLALQQTRGNKEEAARLLGIGKTTLYRRIEQYARGPGIQLQSASKEVFGMEYFLICSNSKCRYIVNLREGAHVLERSKLVIDECPECGHPWSSYCPFCGRLLEATQRGDLYFCLSCEENLRPTT